MVARDRTRGETVKNEIIAASGNKYVDLMLADLSSRAAICQLASDFKRKYDQLHVLINNAGALFLRRRLTVDGLEMTFALNHMGYFLLTNLLLDTIKASAPARIINLSSVAHTRAQMNFDDLQSKINYRGYRAYGKSKLANLLFTYELSRRLNGSGITVNAVHPGFVATKFASNNGRLIRLAMFFINKFALSAEEGAETSIYLASSPEVEGITGRYFVRKRAIKSTIASYDEAAAQRLWQLSEKLAG
jgi:NAD(P)-dependent dehydrogenase (short-subunit alcohol dehydrogenase family)